MTESSEKTEKMKPIFKVELKRRVEKTKTDSENLAKEIFDPTFLRWTPNISSILDKLQIIQDKCDAIKESVQQCKSIQIALEVDPIRFDYVEEICSEINLRKELWTSLQKFKPLFEELKEQEFNALDRKFIENATEHYLKVIVKCENCGYKDSSAVQELKKDVTQVKETFPIIEALCNPKLEKVHWDEIKAIMKTGLLLEKRDFALKTLFSLKAAKHSEAIRNISMAASQECSMKKQLKAVKDKWGRKGFVFKQYTRELQREQITIVSETGLLYIDLDETLTTLNTILGSTYAKRLFEEITALKQQFDLLWQVVDEWLHCQRNWLHLDSIFSSTDIRTHLKKETADFEMMDKQWRQVMRNVVIPSKNVLLNYANTEHYEKLCRLNKSMDKIKKELQHYLDCKRKEFPRFYFLSDGELLPIMSKSTSIAAVEPMLPKCFEGISRLELKPTKPTVEIVGICSSEGEKVYVKPIRTFNDENVVVWLRLVESQMFDTMRKMVKAGYNDYFQSELDRKAWVLDHCSQIVFCVSQLVWTESCEYAVKELSEDFSALTELWQQSKLHVTQLVDALREDLNLVQYNNVTSTITRDVHWRDVVENLINEEIEDINDFAWISQLRYYLEEGPDFEELRVRQLYSDIAYGYEYVGPSSKLVITPLTEKCCMTITTALQMHLGTALTGPAGTGKTETVKALAKAVAVHCVAFNCSEQMENKIMGRLLTGVALQGTWACWDEFNRIDLDVLSVVGQQLLQMYDSVKTRKEIITFNDLELKIKSSFGIFITLNPGYQHHPVLPDNLKSLFRPVAMLHPNTEVVVEVTLFSMGFKNAKVISKKIARLFEFTEARLSKQPHYDFGMRSIKLVLSYAGDLKRSMPDWEEDGIIVKSINHVSLPKFVGQDLEVFQEITRDFFPSVGPPKDSSVKFAEELVKVVEKSGLSSTKGFVSKVQQLNECLEVYTGVMLIGKAGAGKTSCYNTLYSTIATISGKPFSVEVHRIFPKSLSVGQLYGEELKNIREWRYGVVSKVLKKAVKAKHTTWIIFDGPVEPKWVEYLNSALDDNKILCLANAERIKLTRNTKFIFETEDLAYASPATVSRCGMVYTSFENIGWKALIDPWITAVSKNIGLFQRNNNLKGFLEYLLQDSLEKVVQTIERIKENAVLPITVPQMIKGFTSRLTTLLGRICPSDSLDLKKKKMSSYVVFSLAWAFGGALTNSDKIELDEAIRPLFPKLAVPYTGTLYDYKIDMSDANSVKWINWNEYVKDKSGLLMPDGSIFVQTVNSMKYATLIKGSLEENMPVFLVGNPGIGKSVMLQHLLLSEKGLMKGNVYVLPIAYSATTTASKAQSYLEGRMEPKKGKAVLGPSGYPRGVIFVDDVNMALCRKETHRNIPPSSIEFLREILTTNGFYGKQKMAWTKIVDSTLLCAGHPSNYRNCPLPARFTHLFDVYCISENTSDTLKKIFSSILSAFLSSSGFPETIKRLGSAIVTSSVELFEEVLATLKPVPVKFHYTFTTRDLSKLFQSISVVSRKNASNPETFVKLWAHESTKVFGDRLCSETDRKWLQDTIIDLVNTKFRYEWTWNNIFGRSKVIFSSLVNSDYSEVTEYKELLKALEAGLDSYNEDKGINNRMNLVFFDAAVEYINSIARVLRQKRGNCSLVGVSGSGKESSALLASHMLESGFVKVRVSKSYKKENFREDIKAVMTTAGVKGKSTTFMLNEYQLANAEFFEDINSILTTGEINGLFRADEFDCIIKEMGPVVANLKRPENKESKYSTFVERVKENLHIVLNMSPVGDTFRKNCRKYPSILNQTHLIYFMQWPEHAFKAVCHKLTDEMTTLEMSLRLKVMQMFPKAHILVSNLSEAYSKETRNKLYVTPKSFIDAINFFYKQYESMQINYRSAIERLGKGLRNFQAATRMVTQLRESLSKLQPVIEQNTVKTTNALNMKELESKRVEEEEEKIETEKNKLYKQKTLIELSRAEAEKELNKVQPYLEEAREGLETINNKDVAKIKSYFKPPKMVMIVMEAVSLLLTGEKRGWEGSRDLLNEKGFFKRLKALDFTKVSSNTIKTLKEEYTPGFDFKEIAQSDTASVSLAKWCVAMVECYDAYQKIIPQEEKLKKIEAEYKEKEKEVMLMEEALDIIKQKLRKLEHENRKLADEARTIMEQREKTAYQLANAELLAKLLYDEGLRWEASIEKLKENEKDILGNVFLSSIAISYAGPFAMKYREQLLIYWKDLCKETEVPFSADYSIIKTLGDPVEMKQWNLQGLPQDHVSMENAILATKSNRWPLFLDPEGQANKWVRQLEKHNDLIISNLSSDSTKYTKAIIKALQQGKPLLLEDVEADIDFSIYSVLGKKTFRSDVGERIYVGDKDVLYNPSFRLYLVCKNSRSFFTPEIFTMLNVINFAVTFDALEEQLLVEVVLKEKPELENERTKQIIEVAQYQRQLTRIEEDILERLTNATEETILMSVELIKSLEKTKRNSQEIERKIKDAQMVEHQINNIREQYRIVATRGAVLYFVLTDLGKINYMYQFSFTFFKSLFVAALGITGESSQITSPSSRNQKIMGRITESLYTKVCNGLFNKYKGLFAFLVACSIRLQEGHITQQQLDIFVKGIDSGHAVKEEIKASKPKGVQISEEAWQLIKLLDSKIPHFRGIIESFSSYFEEWKKFVNATDPYTEVDKLTFYKSNKLTAFEKLLLVKTIHPGKIRQSCARFVEETLGRSYTVYTIKRLESAITETSQNVPLILILAPGTDPTSELNRTARTLSGVELHILSLGRSQEARIEREFNECKKSGEWLLLQNCHLGKSFNAKLEILVNSLENTVTVHPNFRLLLTTSPADTFPSSILKTGIKYTVEADEEVKTDLHSETVLMDTTTKEHHWKLLAQRLITFHAAIQKRSKLGSLGWSTKYQFTQTDFEATRSLLKGLFERSTTFQWNAFSFVATHINYGGRVLDDFDHRILEATFNKLFNSKMLEKITLLENENVTEMFEMHENARVIFETKLSNKLISGLIRTQPANEKGRVSINVGKVIEELMENMPTCIERNGLYNAEDSLAIVLKHEIDAYNSLIKKIKDSLTKLSSALNGDIPMTSALEDLYEALLMREVPKAWKIYDSLKKLAGWFSDLVARVDFIKKWKMNGSPRSYWLSAFIYPEGFLAGIAQNYARRFGKPIESVTFQFEFTTQLIPGEARESYKPGCYIHGLYLEGANWSLAKQKITDSIRGQMAVQMPAIVLVPCEEKRQRMDYPCPVYKTGKRKDGYVMTIDLPSEESVEKWILRRIALLCELPDQNAQNT
eukprot:TRINITY_DN1419_c0_g1_i1.p1 TRINITY_DN1419_c0_g1~~TRINITY_DN1419_c0_g1_i1.p1  ORF type:complete len:3283 (-),score=375.81 TRINITY_DN1419_c0_g1_i1:11360-21208(-)